MMEMIVATLRYRANSLAENLEFDKQLLRCAADIIEGGSRPTVTYEMVDRYKTAARAMTEYANGDDVIRAGIAAALKGTP